MFAFDNSVKELEFEGKTADFEIHRELLSESEVLELYQRGKNEREEENSETGSEKSSSTSDDESEKLDDEDT